MFVRGYHSAAAANSTEKFESASIPTSGEGNLFIGGKGAVGISNSSDGFLCIGNDATMSIVNQGSGCYFQFGEASETGIGLDMDMDGAVDTIAANNVISVGNDNTFVGSSYADVLFSLGTNCEANMGDGADKVFVSGEGSTVNGEGGDDVIAGTPEGLDLATLLAMSPIEMLAAIYSKSASILYQSA